MQTWQEPGHYVYKDIPDKAKLKFFDISPLFVYDLTNLLLTLQRTANIKAIDLVNSEKQY